MWNTEQLSVEEQVAMNMGDPDAHELAPPSSYGSYRRNTFEVERPSRVEPEPCIDKWKRVPLHLKH